jgi:glycine/D-amino acid oxidase-like deaminating enzyme
VPDFAFPLHALSSLWERITPSGPQPEPFSGESDVDIAIVGGGIAGLSVALHAARAGMRPILLEGLRIGAGATGASAGIVAPQLVRATPSSILERLGSQRGARFLQLLADAGNYTFGLIRDHALDCAAHQSGLLVPTRSDAAMRRFEATIAQWRPYRTDLMLLDAARLQSISGCRGYAGALLDPSGGGLNPLAYARELARVAQAAGALICEQSRVLELVRDAGVWRLRLARGEVRAARVVLAANGGNPELHPALKNTVIPLPVHEVATEELPRAVGAAILPDNHVLTDIETDVFSVRWAAGGRLISAFPGAADVNPATVETTVIRRLREKLPAYGHQKLDFAWHGVAWIGEGMLPRLVRVDEDLIAVQACNGRGIALNTILGREIARWLRTSEKYTPALDFEPPRPFRQMGLMRHVPRLMLSAAMLLSRLRHGSRGSR